MPEHSTRASRRFQLTVLASLTLLAASAGRPQAPSADGSELRYSPIVKAVNAASPSVVNIHGRKTVRAENASLGAGDAVRQVNGMGTGEFTFRGEPAMPVIECSCGMVMSVAADDPRSSCIRCGGVEFRMMARRGASSYTAEAGHLPTSSELVGDSSSPLIFACIGSAVAGACHAGG